MSHHPVSARLRSALVVLFAFLLPSCGGDGPSGPGDGEPTGIEAIYDVEYQEHTTLFDEAESDVLVDYDAETGEATYAASRFDAAPEAGDVIVVSGLHMRKVVSVQAVGDQYVVQTETAALTDAIRDGRIAWSLTPTWDAATSFRWEGREAQTLANRAAPGDTLQFELDFEGVRHVVQIIPVSEGGELSACTFVFQMTREGAGGVNLVLKAEGTMSMPEQDLQVDIAEGEVDALQANYRGIRCDLRLSLSAAGESGGATSLTLPGAAIEIPIRYLPGPGGVLIPNPIPMSIGIGIQFVTQVTMPTASASALGEASLTLSSDAGFEYHGTSVSSSAMLNEEDISDGSFDSAAPIGIPVDVQFGIAFPRVSLNIVGEEFAWVHTGFTTGSALAWGPVCKSGYAKMVVEGGYDFGFIGFDQIGLKETWVEREQRVDCE